MTLPMVPAFSVAVLVCALAPGAAQTPQWRVPRPTLSPGLTVRDLRLTPAEPKPGDRVLVRAVIANTATETVENVRWELRVNDDLLSSGSRGSLGRGASFDVKAEWRAQVGRFTVMARATAPGVRGGPARQTSRSIDVSVSRALPQRLPIPRPQPIPRDRRPEVAVVPQLTALGPNGGSFVTPDELAGSVGLSTAAPDGGTEVGLSSSDPAVIVVPSIVRVAEGQTTATFQIRAAAPDREGSATITATCGGVSREIRVSVESGSRLLNLALSAARIAGGSSISATVQLQRAAPASGVAVTVTSSQSDVASVPAQVLVPAGSDSTTFTITTRPVTGPANVTINAAAGGGTVSAALAVEPVPQLVDLSPTNTGFNSAEELPGQMTLSGRAPAGGVTVALSSSNPGVVVVPASVTVPEGQTTAGFAIRAASVSSEGPAVVTAVLGGVTRTIAVSVYAAYTVWMLDVASQTVTGGQSLRATVKIWGWAPSGGVTLPVGTDAPGVVVMPASVTVAEGAQEASFEIRTAAVTTTQTALVCVHNPGPSEPCSVDARGGRRRLTLVPGAVPIARLLVADGAYGSLARVWAGREVLGRVELEVGAPAGGAPVRLTSSAPAVVMAPAEVEVAAGKTEAYFRMATTAVAALTTVTVTATLGEGSKTATVEVQPAETLTGLTVAPLEVTGGAVATGTVTLDRPAVAAAAVVRLESDAASVTVPPNVTVAPGQTTASFAVATRAVSAPTTVTLTARFAGASRTVTVTVRPPS